MTVLRSSNANLLLEVEEDEVIDTAQLKDVQGVNYIGKGVPVFTTDGTVQTSHNGEDDWTPADLDLVGSSVNWKRYVRVTTTTAGADTTLELLIA
jgi:hypothetical protein